MLALASITQAAKRRNMLIYNLVETLFDHCITL